MRETERGENAMNVIVAVDENWGIGKDGDQLVYLSQDLKRFKALTTGHPVILGRKTLATFPGGRPLKGRRNLILSRDPGLCPGGRGGISGSGGAAVRCIGRTPFVIGGASVYEQLLPWCDTAYVTRIHAAFPADVVFPNLDRDPDWELAEEEPPLEQDGLFFHYVRYRRIR